MKKIILDLRHITDKEELFDLITQAFDFPKYFGRNLDALYDLLTEIGTDTCVGLFLPYIADDSDDAHTFAAVHATCLHSDMNSYFQKLVQTFTDAELENDHLCVICAPQ